MTDKCRQCGAVLAEKCPRCRRRAERLGRISDALPAAGVQTAVVYFCAWCRRGFEEGAGGRKETVCAGCRPKQQNFLTQINADEVRR